MSIITDLMDLHNRTDDKTTRQYIAKALRREVLLFTEESLPSRVPGYNDRDRLTVEELSLVNDGKKIASIKLVRQRTGMGLLESKQLVEWIMDPIAYPKPDHLR